MVPFGMYFLPVPKLFYSEYLEQPFEDCINCGCSLGTAAVYVIQKRFVIGEAVFEMAICDNCRQQLTETYSEETKAALNERMMQYFGRMAAEVLEQQPSSRPAEDLLDRCMNFCLICSATRENCKKYSLAGLFRRQEIVVQCSAIGQSPVMICDRCEEELSELISQKTRDAWQRFMDEHFDGPPGIDLDIPYEQNKSLPV